MNTTTTDHAQPVTMDPTTLSDKWLLEGLMKKAVGLALAKMFAEPQESVDGIKKLIVAHRDEALRRMANAGERE